MPTRGSNLVLAPVGAAAVVLDEVDLGAVVGLRAAARGRSRAGLRPCRRRRGRRGRSCSPSRRSRGRSRRAPRSRAEASPLAEVGLVVLRAAEAVGGQDRRNAVVAVRAPRLVEVADDVAGLRVVLRPGVDGEVQRLDGVLRGGGGRRRGRRRKRGHDCSEEGKPEGAAHGSGASQPPGAAAPVQATSPWRIVFSRDHARLDELEQVVGAAGLGADAREPVAAERLAADDRAGDVAVDVEVADGQPARHRRDRGRVAARRARRSARRAGRRRARSAASTLGDGLDGEDRAEDLLGEDRRVGRQTGGDDRARRTSRRLGDARRAPRPRPVRAASST